MAKTKIRSALIKARKAKNLTQQEVAELVGINRAFLTNIERGVHSPSLEVAHKIAQVLGAQIEHLFFNLDVRKTNSNGNKSA